MISNQNESDINGLEAKSTIAADDLKQRKDSPLYPILEAVEQLRKGAAEIIVRSKFVEERAEQLERALKQALERMTRKRKLIPTEDNQNVDEVSDLMSEGCLRQEGSEPLSKRGRSQRHCKRCGKTGHNTRTCAVDIDNADDSAVEVEQADESTTST